MNKLALSSCRLALGLFGSLSLVTAADAALTMTINPWNLTYSFSGSFTTAYIPVSAEDGSPSFYIGTGVSVDSYPLGSGTVLNIGTSTTGGAGYNVGFSQSLPFNLSIGMSAQEPGTLEIMGLLGEVVVTDSGGNPVEDVPPGVSMSWTLTGNGVLRTLLTSYPPEYGLYFSSLYGEPLYLFQGNTPFDAVTPSIGQVIIIPEPSSGLLMLAGAGACFLLRRRRRA